MTEKLFLYTWDNLFCNYECGELKVIAPSLDEARQIALNDPDAIKYAEWTGGYIYLEIGVNQEPSSITPVVSGIVIAIVGSA